MPKYTCFDYPQAFSAKAKKAVKNRLPNYSEQHYVAGRVFCPLWPVTMTLQKFTLIVVHVACYD